MFSGSVESLGFGERKKEANLKPSFFLAGRPSDVFFTVVAPSTISY